MHLYEKLIADRASKIVRSLRGRPNTFGVGAASLTEDGAVTSCSTFLGLLLRQVFDEAPTRIPRARHWMDYLSPTDFFDVSPGCIGVIEYDEDREGMSGHCFIVERLNTGGAMRVIDSCKSSHGTDDTRWNGEKGLGGIGIGTMVVRHDGAGNVSSYRWSTLPSSEVMLQGQGQRLLFGRVPRTWTEKESRNG